MTGLQWRQVGECWIVSSPQPQAVVHFLGGAFVGSLPQIFFQGLLEGLARSGLGVIATCYTTDPDHAQIARTVAHLARETQTAMGWQDLPVFGLGQSLGGKLQILSCILDPECREQRRGTILFAYNNSSLDDALPWKRWGLEPLADLAKGANLYPYPDEFEPSPAKLNQLIQTQYSVAPHLLIKFDRDTIDEINPLYNLLSQRFGDQVTYRLLSGDHGTGVSRAYPFQVEQFTPLDALGQFMYESLTQETLGLSRTIQTWIQNQLRSPAV